MEEKVAIFVNTCDSHIEALHPFFELLKKYWPECNRYKIYVNTETIGYTDEQLNIENIYSEKDIPWTTRLRDALQKVREEFLVYFLEDHFLVGKTDNNSLLRCIKTITEKPDIGWIYFPPMGEGGDYMKGSGINDGVFETSKSWGFRVNANVGLWRKKFFQYMLFRDVDPWQYEQLAARASILSSYKSCYYDYASSIFQYHLNPSNGIGIFCGKWLNKNRDLFDKEGISVDFETLGEWKEDANYSVLHTEKELLFMKKYNSGNRLIKTFYNLQHGLKKYDIRYIFLLIRDYHRNKKAVDKLYN